MEKSDRYLILVLLICVILTWLPRLKGPIDLRWDAGGRYILAMSLAEGKGYRMLNEPGEIRSIQEPPLLPLIAAVPMMLLGTRDPMEVGVLLRLLYFALHCALILLTYLFARRYLSPLYSILVTGLLILSTAIIFISDTFRTEIPFTVLVLTFFLLSYEMGKAPAPHRKERPIHFPLQFAILSTLFFLNTAGVALMAAWIVESLIHKKWKPALLRAGAVLVPVLLWFGYVGLVKSSEEFKNPAYPYQRSSYLYSNTDYFSYVRMQQPPHLESGKESLAETGTRFLSNVQKLPAKVFSTMAVDYSNLWHLFRRNPLPSFAPKDMDYRIPFWLGVVAVAGIVFFINDRQWLIVFFVLFYLPPVFIWPFTDEMYRILIPMAPIFAVAFLRMVKWMSRPLLHLGIWSHAPAVVIVSCVFVLQAVVVSHLYRFDHKQISRASEKGEKIRYRVFYYDPAQKSLDETLDWLNTKGDREKIILAMNPEHVFLRTGMKAVRPPFTSDANKAKELIDRIPASYILLDGSNVKLTIEYTGLMVRSFPGEWQNVYSATRAAQTELREYQQRASWRQDTEDLDIPSIYQRVDR